MRIDRPAAASTLDSTHISWELSRNPLACRKRAKGSSMSNAIIKQQGDSTVVADNIWEFRLGAGSFILGALAGTLVTAAVGAANGEG